MSLVAPPWLRGMMWWTWQAAGGWSQPGAAQCRSRVMTARRRWAGMRSVTVPTSRGRLIEAAGPVRVPVRSQDASPPGPESRATALAQDELAGGGPAEPGAGAAAGVGLAAVAGACRCRCRVPSGLRVGAAVRVVFRPRPGARVRLGGEAVQEVVVDAAGDDGGEGGVAVVAGPGGRAGQHRAGLAAGPLSSLRRRCRRRRRGSRGRLRWSWRRAGCPARSGRHAGGQQAAAGFFEGVVAALGGGAGVLGAGFLAEGVQDGLQGGGAPAGQVAVQFPGPAQRGGQPQRPVGEPAVAVAVRAGGPAPDLLGQVGQGGQVRAAGGGGEQDHVRVAAAFCGEQVGPLGDLPGPRHADLPAGQRVGDRGMLGQRPHRRRAPPDAAGRVTRVCQVSHVRGDPCPSSSYAPCAVNAASTRARAAAWTDRARFQAPQALRLHRARHRRRIRPGQPPQPGQHHPQRLTRRRRATRRRPRRQPGNGRRDGAAPAAAEPRTDGSRRSAGAARRDGEHQAGPRSQAGGPPLAGRPGSSGRSPAGERGLAGRRDPQEAGPAVGPAERRHRSARAAARTTLADGTGVPAAPGWSDGSLSG